MTTPNLAKIERVDLREAWPNEARDFTPWLAKNIAELGEALGMDLELQETEASVGGYSLDILATYPDGDRPVIIENQLEATNHDHLGKLLTYAAGYDANVIVWLTREFRDEHRQALDWLNQRTGEDTLFFGVVVELWRIGNSLPAPHFKAVATPNEWGKASARMRSKGGKETYKQFFQDLIDTLREKQFSVSLPNASSTNSQDFKFNYGNAYYTAIFRLQEQVGVMVYLYGDRDRNIKTMESLEEDKVEIESALGATLDWHYPPENTKACRIELKRSGSIDYDSDSLVEIRDWMADHLFKFKQVFGPRLEKLARK